MQQMYCFAFPLGVSFDVLHSPQRVPLQWNCNVKLVYPLQLQQYNQKHGSYGVMHICLAVMTSVYSGLRSNLAHFFQIGNPDTER